MALFFIIFAIGYWKNYKNLNTRETLPAYPRNLTIEQNTTIF
jgi:hypothetical protein